MHSNPPYRPPRGWLTIGKYLLPIGTRASDWLPSAAPRNQRPIAELAAEFPERVDYQTLGESERVSASDFVCRVDGNREVRTLPEQVFPQPFVARIAGGMSYGRQCCVIGPERTAVRETGFYLDGAVQAAKIPVSP